MKKILIRSSLGGYQVKNIEISKNFFSKNLNNYFYLIDKNIYSKNKIIKKIKGNKILIKSNEDAKNYNNISKVIKKIIEGNINRESVIVAIGGGIVQDISGFIASILFRGIKWNFIPTTILAQCDSCIGGKTSINFNSYKNQLGNFYPPKKIFLDIRLLSTLPLKDIKSGLGEMAHYYLVSNAKDWNFYKKNLKKVLKKNFDKKIMRSLIFKSLLIKKKFIEKDEFDTGKRLILNYGHTFGHAIEKITNYKISHGMAVAHGINIANFFSLKLNLINKEKFEEIENQISKIVNLSELKRMNVEHFLKIIKKDKKNKNGQIRLILTRGVGKMFIKSVNKESKFIYLIKEYLSKRVNKNYPKIK
jgi:3-dehydroquinate synthase